jgi:hypothetical protein
MTAKRRLSWVTQAWFNASPATREMIIAHFHDEALRAEAIYKARAQEAVSKVINKVAGRIAAGASATEEAAAREALREPGMSDAELDRRVALYFRYVVQGEKIGKPATGDRADYYPGRPADVEPSKNTPIPPGTYGLPMGRGSAVSSEAEQARALTHLGIMACEQAIALLGQVDEKIGEALQMFLAAGAGSHQDAMREAVEYAAGAREKATEVRGQTGEAALVASRAIW